MTAREGGACIVPALQPGEGQSGEKIQIGGSIARPLREPRGILILSGIKSFLGCGQPRCVGGKLLRPCPLAQRGKYKKYDDYPAGADAGAFWGTARSIQFLAASHSLSNSERSIRKSLPRAGSFTNTASRCQSIPVMTT